MLRPLTDGAMQYELITGFHAVEERLRRIARSADTGTAQAELLYTAGAGPRIKKIAAAAARARIPCKETTRAELDALVSRLEPACRDHRGLVLRCAASQTAETQLDAYLSALSRPGTEKQCVIVLDSITDPHNTGAILRSCDQFGVSLALLPERRGAQAGSAAVSRASAGADSWVPFCRTANLVRAVQQLKDAGFWVYGADADGEPLPNVEFTPRSVIVMGSEGNGIAPLLRRQCDCIVSIPTCGRLDSLNVSVAAGILLYACTSAHARR